MAHQARDGDGGHATGIGGCGGNMLAYSAPTTAGERVRETVDMWARVGRALRRLQRTR